METHKRARYIFFSQHIMIVSFFHAHKTSLSTSQLIDHSIHNGCAMFCDGKRRVYLHAVQGGPSSSLTSRTAMRFENGKQFSERKRKRIERGVSVDASKSFRSASSVFSPQNPPIEIFPQIVRASRSRWLPGRSSDDPYPMYGFPRYRNICTAHSCLKSDFSLPKSNF